MSMHERRQHPSTQYQLRAQLNSDQLRRLRELELFGWELRFVRHPDHGSAQPVLFAGGSAYAVMSEDGHLEETPDFHLRH